MRDHLGFGIISGSIWGSLEGLRSFRGRDHFGDCTGLLLEFWQRSRFGAPAKQYRPPRFSSFALFAMLNAMLVPRITGNTLNDRFYHLNSRFCHLNYRFGNLNDRFAHLNERFGQLNNRFGDFNDRFGHLSNLCGDLKIDLVQLEHAFWSSF